MIFDCVVLPFLGVGDVEAEMSLPYPSIELVLPREGCPRGASLGLSASILGLG